VSAIIYLNSSLNDYLNITIITPTTNRMTTHHISPKIMRIYDNLKNTPYTPKEIRCQHFAVAMQKGKIVSPVGINYHRVKVLKNTRGTMHAEMNVCNYILNNSSESRGSIKGGKGERCILRRKKAKNRP
jgi:hypothetical protein